VNGPVKSAGGISRLSVEIVVATALMILGGAIAIDSYRLGAGWDVDGPQSGYFPFYTGLIVAASSLVTVIQALRGAGSGGEVFVHREAVTRVLSVLLPTVAYVGLVQLFGLYVASPIYIAVFMVRLGRYAWWNAVAMGIAASAAVYFMFEVWFRVPLYRGGYDLLGLLGW
jgi:hypothetical protein